MLIFFQELCLQLFLWLLQLIDGLMEIFSAISGVTNVNYHGQSVNIIEFLAGDSNGNDDILVHIHFSRRAYLYLASIEDCI